MVFNIAVLDVSNIFYRLYTKVVNIDQKSKDYILKDFNNLKTKVYNEFKQFVFEELILNHNIEKVYLLFDPFYTINDQKDEIQNLSSLRKQRLGQYKANRKNDNIDISILKSEVFENIISFFIQNKFKDKIFIYSSQSLEADDYCEVISKINKEKNIVYITSDLDYSRYLNDKSMILCKGLKLDGNNENYISYNSFYNKYKFKPSIMSVVIYKAFFGDTSDNIEGSLNSKSTVIYRSTANKLIEIINSMVEEGVSLADVKLALVDSRSRVHLESLKQFESFLEECKSSMTNKSYLDFISITQSNIDVIDSYVKTEEELNLYRRLSSIDYTGNLKKARESATNYIKSKKKFSFNKI